MSRSAFRIRIRHGACRDSEASAWSEAEATLNFVADEDKYARTLG